MPFVDACIKLQRLETFHEKVNIRNAVLLSLAGKHACPSFRTSTKFETLMWVLACIWTCRCMRSASWAAVCAPSCQLGSSPKQILRVKLSLLDFGSSVGQALTCGSMPPPLFIAHLHHNVHHSCTFMHMSALYYCFLARLLSVQVEACVRGCATPIQGF